LKIKAGYAANTMHKAGGAAFRTYFAAFSCCFEEIVDGRTAKCRNSRISELQKEGISI
jgi:hypothetical protein